MTHTKCCVVAVVVLMGACSAAIAPLTSGGQNVAIKKGDPPDGYQEIGPVSASHGSGCGLFGTFGTHEGAYAALKNAAAEMGADFVRLDVAKEPYSDGQCAHNEYVLRGVAFKRR